MGHPGQPGYRVVAMARLEMTAQMFKMLDADRRGDLRAIGSLATAYSWVTGVSYFCSSRPFAGAALCTFYSRPPVG